MLNCLNRVFFLKILNEKLFFIENLTLLLDNKEFFIIYDHFRITLTAY
jgi:hypothetical protein